MAQVQWTNTRKMMEFLGDNVTAELKLQIAKDKLFATGRLYNSIGYRVYMEARGNRLGFEIISYSKGLWDIYYVLNEGGQPITIPPTSAIIKWMKAKGIQPMENGKVKRGTDRAYKRSAFAIARSIYLKGIIKRFGYQGADGWVKVTNSSLFNGSMELVLDAVEKDMWNHFKTHGGVNPN